MKSCRDCRSYKDCPGKPWFHYGEIKWCPLQILWIISNAEVLEVGTWPRNPEGSGYIDPQIKTGYASEGYFTKPVAILAEVEYRLKRTGTGQLLLAEVKAGYTVLSDEARLTLNFISGWRRKRMSFSVWKKQRRYRSKKVAT